MEEKKTEITNYALYKVLSDAGYADELCAKVADIFKNGTKGSDFEPIAPAANAPEPPTPAPAPVIVTHTTHDAPPENYMKVKGAKFVRVEHGKTVFWYIRNMDVPPAKGFPELLIKPEYPKDFPYHLQCRPQQDGKVFPGDDALTIGVRLYAMGVPLEDVVTFLGYKTTQSFSRYKTLWDAKKILPEDYEGGVVAEFEKLQAEKKKAAE